MLWYSRSSEKGHGPCIRDGAVVAHAWADDGSGGTPTRPPRTRGAERGLGPITARASDRIMGASPAPAALLLGPPGRQQTHQRRQRAKQFSTDVFFPRSPQDESGAQLVSFRSGKGGPLPPQPPRQRRMAVSPLTRTLPSAAIFGTPVEQQTQLQRRSVSYSYGCLYWEVPWQWK